MGLDILPLVESGIKSADSVTFSEYVVASAEYFRRHDSCRLGQSYFNVLDTIRPDIANAIRGGTTDAFYDNDLLVKMLAVVYAAW